MKNLWKYITGLFSFVVGLLVLSGKKNKKLKEIDTAIKDVKKDINKAKGKGDALEKTLESKKKALKEIKKEKFKKKNVGKKEATDFMKKFSKGRK